VQVICPAKTASIEFFVDEAAGLLMALEHDPARAEGAPPDEVLRLPLGEVRAREPADIQRAIGRLVLSFLNSRSSKGLNLPRDLEDEKRLDDENLNQLLLAARSNKPEAVYDLAVSLIARGMSNESWGDIEQGEVLLSQAVAAGHPAAIAYQSETWALIRPRLEHKFKRDGSI
jgi:TPR repeat protein